MKLPVFDNRQLTIISINESIVDIKHSVSHMLKLVNSSLDYKDNSIIKGFYSQDMNNLSNHAENFLEKIEALSKKVNKVFT
jgi:hypothetical protein